jgi:hypothetical protein
LRRREFESGLRSIYLDIAFDEVILYDRDNSMKEEVNYRPKACKELSAGGILAGQ